MHYPGLRRVVRRGGMIAALLAIAASAHAAAPPSVAVTVTGLSGEDKDLAEAVCRTFVADLARSAKVTVADTSMAPSTPVRFQIIGSCHALDTHMLVNVRVMDCSTGRAVPGGADNLLADRGQMEQVMEGLAGRIAARIGETVTTSASPAAHPAGMAHRTVRYPVAAGLCAAVRHLACAGS